MLNAFLSYQAFDIACSTRVACYAFVWVKPAVVRVCIKIRKPLRRVDFAQFLRSPEMADIFQACAKVLFSEWAKVALLSRATEPYRSSSNFLSVKTV